MSAYSVPIEKAHLTGALFGAAERLRGNRMLPAKERQKKLGLIVALLSYMGPGLRELISPATFFLCKGYLSVDQSPKKSPVR